AGPHLRSGTKGCPADNARDGARLRELQLQRAPRVKIACSMSEWVPLTNACHHGASSSAARLSPARMCLSLRAGCDIGCRYFFLSTLWGLRLPMRPLSLPAAGSISALMRLGWRESIALFT